MSAPHRRHAVQRGAARLGYVGPLFARAPLLRPILRRAAVHLDPPPARPSRPVNSHRPARKDPHRDASRTYRIAAFSAAWRPPSEQGYRDTLTVEEVPKEDLGRVGPAPAVALVVGEVKPDVKLVQPRIQQWSGEVINPVGAEPWHHPGVYSARQRSLTERMRSTDEGWQPRQCSRTVPGH